MAGAFDAFLQGSTASTISSDRRREYREVRYADELQYSVYNFELADVPTLWKLFEIHEGKPGACSTSIRTTGRNSDFLCSRPTISVEVQQFFNTLDSRGAISVTERVGVIGRIRKQASVSQKHG